jgi:hypothetical protein
MPRATQAIATTVAPMPIPTFAPVDRSLVLSAWFTVGDGVAVGNVDDDVGARVDSEGNLEEEEEPADRAGLGSPNFNAIVNLGRLPASVQQSVVLPQHHSRLVAFPLHGVTRTSYIRSIGP